MQDENGNFDASNLKELLASYGYSLTDIVDILNKKYSRNDSVQNLSNKIRAKTIRYKDVLEIADAINMTIVWIEKDLNLTQLIKFQRLNKISKNDEEDNT